VARLPKACPECKKEGTLKRIVYGMPGPDFDFEKYVVGGCIPDDAIAECSNCGWTKRKKQKETPWGLSDHISG
jgi:hypothetical protein